MKKEEFYIGQILAKCNSNLNDMQYWANKGKVNRVEILSAKTETLLEILEFVFNYKNTDEIKNKILDYRSIAKEHDYYSIFEFL